MQLIEQIVFTILQKRKKTPLKKQKQQPQLCNMWQELYTEIKQYKTTYDKMMY